MNYRGTERKIQEALKRLRNGEGGSLYDITKWCVELFNASDDYAAAVGITGDDVLDRLNGFLRDFAIDLEDAISLLKHYPDREQWNRPVLDMLDEIYEKLAEEKRQSRSGIKRRRATLREIEELEAKLKDAEYRAAKASAEVDQLRAENSELRAENRELRIRIDQLERILQNHLQAVR